VIDGGFTLLRESAKEFEDVESLFMNDDVNEKT
jgi:hypothetical protein